MARGTSQSQTASSSTSCPDIMAPRDSAAATDGLRRRRLGSSACGSASFAVGGLGGGSSNMLRLYTDDAPGLKISPTVVLVMSLCFIGFVTALSRFLEALSQQCSFRTLNCSIGTDESQSEEVPDVSDL